jgi:cyclopropane-fatty-acyl-phospholipid synthase
MNIASLATSAAEQMDLPDPLLRAAITAMVTRSARQLARPGQTTERAFAETMRDLPVALHTEAANAQHYELPPEFFGYILGIHRKYSSCLYPIGTETLDVAEGAALERSCALAGLADGQLILELGCGWGSLSLYMAELLPNAHIVGVSNSAGQRAYIEATAASRSLRNLRIMTADMNDFDTDKKFDRIVSIEMFEHMSNWAALLGRMRGWLAQDGRVFLHVFTHRTTPYRFDHENGADWIAQHFFTGGIMPSHGLIGAFSDIFSIEAEQRWSGTHYQRTALQWLENFDRHRAAIDPILRETYGAAAPVWARRWRLFFLAVAGLFGHGRGEFWGVSQYRLRAA